MKSGWTAAVLIGGSAAAPRVLDSRRIEISDPDAGMILTGRHISPGKHLLPGRHFLPGVILAALSLAAPARAQDRVIGLLSLPEVFGEGECATFVPKEIALRAAPRDAKPFAFIRVDGSPSPVDGCRTVTVHDGARGAALPTREFDYENPGAIVLEERGRWFKVRLPSGAGWIEASPVDRFLPLAELFEEFAEVTSVTESFTGRLVPAPGRPANPSSPRPVDFQSVRVIEIRNVIGQSWVRVELMSHSICDAAIDGPPTVVASGWMPLYGPDGEPTVWFASRGC